MELQILDAFDTENYVQMVMPLHGQGIDLYEFVEKGARIDEPLASYIFRQVRTPTYRMRILIIGSGGRCSGLFTSQSHRPSGYKRRKSNHQRTISYQIDRFRCVDSVFSFENLETCIV